MKLLYKILNFKVLIVLLTLTSGVLSANAQCVLQKGDVVFTGYDVLDDNNNGTGTDLNDRFSFVILRDITAATTISFTDLGWTNLNAFQAPSKAQTDGILTWTAGANLPAGTQVVINCKFTPTASIGTLTLTMANWDTTIDNPSLMDEYIAFGDLSGDQIFAFTGTYNSSPLLLAGMSINRSSDPTLRPSGGWDTSLDDFQTSSSASVLPSGLSSGAQNLFITRLTDPDFPDALIARVKALGTVTGKTTILATVNNPSNWDISPLATPSQDFVPFNSTTACILAAPVLGTVADQTVTTPTTTTTFTVGADATACSYQWQSATPGLTDWANISNGGNYSGVTTAALTVNNIAIASDGRKFRVIVSGAIPVTSNEAMLHVTPTNSSIILPANANYRLSQSLDFVINYTAPVYVTGTPRMTLTLGSGGGSAAYLSGSGTNALVFRYTVTGGDFDYNGIDVPSGIGLNGGTIKTLYNTNASLTITSSGNYPNILVDGVLPVVSAISKFLPSFSPSNATSLTYRISFNEPVSGVSLTDFTLVGTGTATGTITSVAATFNAAVYDIFVTASGEGTLKVDLNNSGTGIKDNALNDIAAGFTTGESYTLDHIAPAVAVSSSASPTSQSNVIPVTVTFSESVTGFAAGDVTVGNGSVSGFSGSGANYTFNVTAVSPGTVTINIAAGAASDAAFNQSTVAPQFTILYDPTTTVTSINRVTATPTNATTLSYTVTFAQAVTGLTTSNFSLSTTGSATGTILNLTGSGTTYTVNLNSVSGTGTIRLDLVNDNSLLPSLSNEPFISGEAYSIDQTAPNISMTSTATDPTAIAAIPVAVTFSESVTGFTSADITLTNATLSGFAGSGANYSFTLNASGPGAVVAGITAYSSQDAAGNLSNSGSFSITYDPSTTVTSIVRASANPTKATSLAYTVTFAQSVTGLSASNFSRTLAPGVTGNIQSVAGSGTTYTVTLNNVSGDGTLRLNLANSTGVVPSISNAPYTSGEAYTIDNTAANTPFGLSALPLDGSVKLDWGGNSADTQLYTLYWGTSASPSTFLSTIPFGTKTYTHTGRTNGTTYYYRISASDAVGNESPLSADVSATPKGPQTITFAALSGKNYGDAPGTLSATSTSGLSVTFSSSDPTIASVTGNTITYLKPGTVNITASQAGNGTFDAAPEVVRSLTIARAQLTVTAVPDFRNYDGTAYNGNQGVTYSGFLYSDNESNSLTGPVIYGGNSQGAVNAGTYNITPSGLSSDKYNFTYTSGILTINKIGLTVTATDQTKQYDNVAYTGGNGVSYSGFATGDNAANSLTGAVVYSGTSQGAKSVGSYVITPGGYTSANYNLSYINGTLQINKATLSIVANDLQKYYDGVAYSGGNGVVYSGYASGDNTANSLTGALTYSGSSQGARNAGSYTITPGGYSSANYNISYIGGGLRIDQVPLIIAANAVTKTYDGVGFAGGNGVTFSGFMAGDNAGNSLTGTLVFTGNSQGAINAGIYDLTPAGYNAVNYFLINGTGVLTIDKANLTVTATGASKTYDGVAYSGGNGVSYSGFVTGDNESNSLTGTLAYSGTSQGAVNSGSYIITPAGYASVNYGLSYVNGSLTIGKANLTVTATPQVKNYDNIAYTGGNGVSYSGFAAGDNESNSLTGTLAYSGTSQGAKAAGSYVIIPGGYASGNYNLAYTNGSLTINKITLTVTGTGQSKTYNNIAYAGGNGVSYSGFASGDNEGNSLTGTLSYSGTAQGAKNAGSYLITPGGYASANYTLNYADGSLTINKASVTVTAASQTKIYDNIAYAGGNGVTYSGFAAGDNAANSLTGVISYSGTAQGSKNAGTYVITPGGYSSSNYTIAYADGSLIISKATLMVTANGQSKTYDNVAYAGGNGVTYSGFASGDNAGNSLTGTLAYSGTAQGSRNVGSYTLIPSGYSSSNYTLAYTNGSLTISKANLTITATGQVKTYDGTSYSGGNGVTYSGFTTGDNASNSLTGTLTYSGTAQGAKNAGSYLITPAGYSSSNYLLGYADGSLTINKANLTVTAAALVKTYDNIGFAGGNGVTYTGFATGDQPGNSLTGTLSYLGTAQGAKNVGSYLITPGGYSSANYSLAYADGTLTINKGNLSATATSHTKTYDGTSYSGGNGVTFAGFATGESAANLSGTLSYSGSSQSAKNVGSYLIIPSGYTSNNYTISYTNGSLNIGAKSLTITADNKTRIQGQPNPALTASYTGFVTGESSATLTSPASLSTTATPASPQGSYPISVSGATAQNYSITHVNGTLTVTPGVPTNITLAQGTLFENRAAGTSAGTLSSTSDDPNATFTYSLVAGTGSTDNASFSISGNQVLTAANLNFEARPSYSILVRSTTQFGLTLDKQFTITLSDVNEVPTITAITSQLVCFTTAAQTTALSGVTPGPETAQSTTVTLSSDLPNMFAQLDATNTAITYRLNNNVFGTATITVTVRDNGGTANNGTDTFTSTFTITVNQLPAPAISSSLGTDISKGAITVLTATGGTSYSWATAAGIISGQNTAVLTVKPLVNTTYTVTVSNASGCSSTQSISLTVLEDFKTIEATNIMSPDGDGINDFWVIKNIELYPNNEVRVFDKAGRVLFSKKNYLNTWDATINGSPLSEGTYYYIVDFGGGKLIKKGYITILRQN